MSCLFGSNIYIFKIEALSHVVGLFAFFSKKSIIYLYNLLKKGININRNITLENYIVKHWLPRKNHEVKISTYMRYSGLTRRINAALGSEKLRDISVMDIYSSYDDLREAKSEQITFTPNETCRRLLKDGYTRPETVRLTGMGMGTVDSLRAGKDVSLVTAQRTSTLLLFRLICCSPRMIFSFRTGLSCTIIDCCIPYSRTLHMTELSGTTLWLKSGCLSSIFLKKHVILI